MFDEQHGARLARPPRTAFRLMVDIVVRLRPVGGAVADRSPSVGLPPVESRPAHVQNARGLIGLAPRPLCSTDVVRRIDVYTRITFAANQAAEADGAAQLRRLVKRFLERCQHSLDG